MDALCQSFGELMMDVVGECEGLEACFVWWRELLGGENIPDDRDPKDWKVVFLGDMEDTGGLSPGDRGAIAGVLFIPELYIWVQLFCPIHTAWTHLPLTRPGSSAKFVYSTASLMQNSISSFFQLKSSHVGSGNNIPILKVHSWSSRVRWSSLAAIASSVFIFFPLRGEGWQRKSVQHVSVTKSSSSSNPGVLSWRDFHATSKPLRKESGTGRVQTFIQQPFPSLKNIESVADLLLRTDSILI